MGAAGSFACFSTHQHPSLEPLVPCKPIHTGKLVGGKEWRGQRAYNVERGGFPTPAGGFTSDASDSALFDVEGSLVLPPDEAAAKAAHNAAAMEADAQPLEYYGVTDGAIVTLVPHLMCGGALNLK